MLTAEPLVPAVSPSPPLPFSPSPRLLPLWHHLAALSIGLAFNSKGPPGLFPLVFLLAFSAVQRRWDVALKFVTSGAIVTMLVLSGAWYFYAGASHGLDQFMSELRAVGTGEDHDKPFYFYIPYIFQAAAPWSGMMVVGIGGAIVRWRKDARLRIVLLWCGSILLPLCVTGNKQFHYLFPLMPPLMILAGWAIDIACGGRNRFPHRADGVAAAVLVCTVGVIAAAGLAGVPVAARVIVGTIRPIDWTVGGIVIALLALPAIMLRLRGRLAGMAALFSALLAAFPLVLGYWYPRLQDRTLRDSAADIRAISPNGPYCFYGSDMHLPLVFYLRTPVPLATHREKLEIHLKKVPSVLLICSEELEEKPPHPLRRPPMDIEGTRITPAGKTRDAQHRYELYQTSPSAYIPLRLERGWAARIRACRARDVAIHS